VSQPLDLLIAGAGPTGLALALQAHNHGARIRIIDRRSTAIRPSRALILHAQTLEGLRPLGVTEPLLARGNTAPEFELHLGARLIRVSLADFEIGDTAFPPLTLVRQMDVENALLRALAECCLEVEWDTELVALEEGPTGVRATLRSPTGTTTIESAFVAGCDGPESTVRRAAGISWRGGPYRQAVVVADVELEPEPPGRVGHVIVGRDGVVWLLPVGEYATWRLLGTRPALKECMSFGQPGPPVAPTELQNLLDGAYAGLRIGKVAWSAQFAVQHRLATHFRRGRIFLAGDAAHAYSPATGQGMNSGIQDALNLGWKLAFAQNTADPEALLDSYERERRPAVQRVLALTHAVFWLEADISPLAVFIRGVLAPLGAPAAAALVRHPRFPMRMVSLGSRVRAGLRTCHRWTATPRDNTSTFHRVTCAPG
jgi:2-polyprenyl-6-methoxyphenol hydroxylase-like FAD-dependent oxidoreductase